MPLYSAFVRPHLEHAIPENWPLLKKDINHPERIQRAEKGWGKGLRGLTYEDRLKVPKNKRLMNYLILTHNIL